MKEVSYWEAEDGKQFSTPYECRMYEYSCRLKKLHGGLVALNEDGTPTNLFEDLYGASCLRLDTREAVKFWCDINDYFGYSFDGWDEPGYYYFSEGDGGWRNLDEDIADLVKKRAKLASFDV